MAKNTVEIFSDFYKYNIRNLIIFNCLFVISFSVGIIFFSIERVKDDSSVLIEKSKSYFLKLALSGDYESIIKFIDAENSKTENVRFRFISNSSNIDAKKIKQATELSIGGEKFGWISYDIYYLRIIPWLSFAIFVFVIGMMTAISVKFYRKTRLFIEDNIIQPLVLLSESIKFSENLADLTQSNQNIIAVSEINLIRSTLVDFGNRLLKSEVAEVKAMVAQQVAHDIRSPLSALEMISSDLHSLPEERRIIIRNAINRIRDIANTLSVKSVVEESNLNEANNNKDQVSELTLLVTALDGLVTEKRVEFRNRLGVIINFDQTKASYGLFSKINLVDFKRVMSNIINNSVESFGENSGIVEIILSTFRDKEVLISVVDNGRGIPEEKIPELGKRGNTFGKSGGSGLGLAYAKECILNWGGRLEIDSVLDKYTRVNIYLNLESTPTWFVPKIVVGKRHSVIVLDDDQSMHQIWNERFGARNNLHLGEVSLIHMSSFVQFKDYYRTSFHKLENAVFLLDFEILGESVNGLDLIEQCGIHSQAILVTSHFEDSNVRERCDKIGVKLIPKSMAGFVPIEFVFSA